MRVLVKNAFQFSWHLLYGLFSKVLFVVEGFYLTDSYIRGDRKALGGGITPFWWGVG